MNKYRIEKLVIDDEFHFSFFRDNTLVNYIKNNYMPEDVEPDTIGTYDTLEEAKNEISFETCFIKVVGKNKDNNCYKVEMELYYIEKIGIDEEGEIEDSKLISYANFSISNKYE